MNGYCLMNKSKIIFNLFLINNLIIFGLLIILSVIIINIQSDKLSENANSIYSINDNVLFSIDWLESSEENYNRLNTVDGHEPMVIYSKQSDVFQCHIPVDQQTKDFHQSDILIHNPDQLDAIEQEFLSRIFAPQPCAMLIESFWVYELCHNSYIRQFHDDHLDDGTKKTTEYILGQSPYKIFPDKQTKFKFSVQSINSLMIGGIKYPYYEVNFKDGTICDLTGQPRNTSVRYICNPNVIAALEDVHELSTCSYLAIVSTKYLCKHPQYQKQDALHVNKVTCRKISYRVPSESHKPREWLEFERQLVASSMFGSEQNVNSGLTSDNKFKTAISSTSTMASNEEPGVLVMKLKANLDQKSAALPDLANPPRILPKDKQGLLESFMAGEYCISGGAGWWKHEFCFMKSAIQQHEESAPLEDSADNETPTKSLRTVIVLGIWNEERHREWLEVNQRYKPTLPANHRTEINQFYGSGDVCQETGKRRQFIAVIRCLISESTAISITFSEPTSCHYVLTVSSSVFCNLVEKSDEWALPLKAV